MISKCRPTWRDTYPALRRGGATDPDERPRRRPGVAESAPHQRLDALLRLPELAAEHLGHFFLQLVGQQVDVAAGLEVQNRAECAEVLGLLQLPRGALEFDFGAAGFQQPDVPGRRDVAETPGALLMSGSSW